MALEQEVAALRVAVETLTATLTSGAAAKPAKAPKAAKDEPAPSTPPAATTATAPAGSTQSPTSAPAAVGLKDVADFFMALAGKDRATAVAIVAKYNATKLSEVPAASLGAVLDACHVEAGKLGGGLVRNAAGVVEFTANAAPASAASSLI